MAVYTHISREELDLFTEHYSIENVLEFSGIKGGTSNSNYLLKTLEKNYILTIFEERTNQDNLQFFFDLMNHLNKNNVKCPEVIQDKKGNYSNSIQNKKAVITSFLKGRSIDQIKPIHCASLGSTIARMHKESARLEMTRENELGFVNLNSLIQTLKNFDDNIDAQVIDLINEEYTFLSGNLGHSLPSGIIHADLFPDNIFFEGNEVTGIIDFYFACTDYYAYEIAICLNAWCFEPNNNDLMNHLNKNNVKCPEVIQDKKGNYSNSIQNKKAVITSFLKGRSIDQIKPIHCASLGSTIARMHKESARLEMTRENELGFVNLNSLIQTLKNFDDNIDAQVIDLINEEYTFLSGNLGHSLPSGIIHADLFPDNIFFEGNEVTGIIDFYFACTDYYAYEIAICLNAWCFEPNNNEFNPTKAKHLLGSYNQLREFSEEEKKALPLLTRASSLRYLLTRLIDYYSHDDNELILKKDPNEYLTKLQFHQSVKKVGEYGL